MVKAEVKHSSENPLVKWSKATHSVEALDNEFAHHFKVGILIPQEKGEPLELHAILTQRTDQEDTHVKILIPLATPGTDTTNLQRLKNSCADHNNKTLSFLIESTDNIGTFVYKFEKLLKDNSSAISPLNIGHSYVVDEEKSIGTVTLSGETDKSCGEIYRQTVNIVSLNFSTSSINQKASNQASRVFNLTGLQIKPIPTTTS